MIDPLNALLIGLLVLVVISFIIWPRIGIIADGNAGHLGYRAHPN